MSEECDLQQRRSQKQRRESTVARIIGAAVSSLGEVGYAKTTIARVCEISGVSQGGLSRHFPTRLDLMVATAETVGVTNIAAFRDRVARPHATTVELLQLLRDCSRSSLNSAWYELLGAARTDAPLMARLAPIAARLHEDILGFARTLPLAQAMPEAIRDAVLFTVIHLFDGEAISTAVVPHPEQEAVRIELLVALLEAAADAPRLSIAQ